MTTMRLEGLRTAAARAAAARSSVYRWLAEAFAFPTADLAEAAASGRLLMDLRVAADALPFALATGPDMDDALSGSALASESLQEQYIRLFEVGAGRPPCPLYEGSHRAGRMKIMEELVRFYEHFGLQARPGDQPDHLCSELEFAHYLSFKEAAARSSGAEAAGLQLAQRDFLARHLCRWAPRVVVRLEDCEAGPFYRSLARLMARFCESDLAYLKRCGGKPDPEIGPLPD